MVEQTKFWGMPLRTLRQRRLLVVLYYLLFATLAGLGLWWGPWSHLYTDLILFTGVLGGLLGGISAEAPVKKYEEPGLPMAMGDGTQTLNLSGRRNAWAHESLDERERTERDRAHYTAYRILRWTLGAAGVAYALSLKWTYPGLGKELPVLVWILVVYVLSLPQAVVLWTEPEGPAGELGEVR
ncbi:MAG: hypothetical protein WB439_02600 [Acidobacteriaceae bacterium]